MKTFCTDKNGKWVEAQPEGYQGLFYEIKRFIKILLKLANKYGEK